MHESFLKCLSNTVHESYNLKRFKLDSLEVVETFGQTVGHFNPYFAVQVHNLQYTIGLGSKIVLAKGNIKHVIMTQIKRVYSLAQTPRKYEFCSKIFTASCRNWHPLNTFREKVHVRLKKSYLSRYGLEPRRRVRIKDVWEGQNTVEITILTIRKVFAFLLFSRPFSFTILYSSNVAVFITTLASDLISFATSCRTFTPFTPFGPSWYIGTLVSESTGKQKTNALFDHFFLKINFLKWQQAMVQAAF